ncbi:sodium-dependent proline transporter-like isoform X2 [Coccinella septempunctata]|uniref:sodium-dependent proline transporter-like isoform X2 n=1 Tax=Coccinella septempunctata TaxID=41139 RepID=UPI001D087342|nr:sodium-dependent proline transporter-like isoform X2 [Coccinella septempunctata]
MVFWKKKDNATAANAAQSISQRESADGRSHVTILDPRESPATGSRMGDLITLNDFGDFWSSRAEFVFATLLYCLNIGNLWRFPTQAMRYGEGAFFYVYIILSVIFGIPLLFFEVAIGQYTNKGLMKVFHIIPVAEGISCSMVFYSNTVIHVFDMINIFNFIYFFSFVRTRAPLSTRDHYGEMCFYENRTNSLENLHFLNEVVMVSDDLNCSFNARNLCIIFVFWLMIWVYTANEYTVKKHFTMTVYVGTIIVLTVTLIAATTVPGAPDGIIRLLSPPWSNFNSYKLYLHAFQQVLITLGLGMGPLINFGSYTTFRTPINIDAVTVTLCTLVATCIMTWIVFAAVGVYGHELGYSPAVLEGQEYYVHTLLSKLFIRLPTGYKNLNIFLFYGAFFSAGFYVSVKYSELLVQLLYSKWDINPKYNTRIIFALCIGQFFIAIGMFSEHGIRLLYWGATNIFTVFSVLTLVILETMAVVFIYRMRNFCEDVEFMIGCKPNWWYRIIWYITPFIYLIVLAVTCFEYCQIGVDGYDIFAFVVYLVVVWIPVISHAIYACVSEHRKGQISRIFYPREVQTAFQDYMNWRETASLNSRDM